MEFQEYMERLRAAFINDRYADEIKRAKEEFIAAGGELGNGVEGYQEVLDIFFDWYIFERRQSGEEFTPLQLFIRDGGISGEDKKIYSCFENSIHSAFVVKKAYTSAINIKVTDMFSKNKYLVDSTSKALFEKGDIVEARLLPFAGGYRFSGAFCFYPDTICGIMKAKIKEARKKGGENSGILLAKFRKLKTIWSRCSNMDIKKVHALMEEGLIA